MPVGGRHLKHGGQGGQMNFERSQEIVTPAPVPPRPDILGKPALPPHGQISWASPLCLPQRSQL
jgi:hypothetical protein